MRLYLDSSALVKLVKKEAETDALRRFLQRHKEDAQVTSELSQVEVVRSVAAGGATAIAHARRLLARIDQVHLDRDLLDAAATLAPGSTLRSLHALHLATARAVGADLRVVLTYDARMRDAATALGIPTDAPT